MERMTNRANTPTKPKRFLKKKSVAARYDCCEKTVDRRVKRGVIPPPDLFQGRFPLWLEDKLDAYDASAAREALRTPCGTPESHHSRDRCLKQRRAARARLHFRSTAPYPARKNTAVKSDSTTAPQAQLVSITRIAELVDSDLDYVPFGERDLVAGILDDFALYLRKNHPAFSSLTLLDLDQQLMPLEHKLLTRIHGHVREFRCNVGAEIASTLRCEFDED